MIDVVGSHAGQSMPYREPESAENGGVSNARQFEQLRGLRRSCRKDHLSSGGKTCLDISDARGHSDRAAIIHLYTQHMRVRTHREIFRFTIGLR